jgi:tRNA (cmo5U34)-methyltransferase
MGTTWEDEGKVREYVGRVGGLAARGAGAAELVEALPDRVGRVLDLGCGDGRLMGVVLAARADVSEAIGLDRSHRMLGLARERFGDDPRVVVAEHDLREALPDCGSFDVIVSGFAIHHLSHARNVLAERRC